MCSSSVCPARISCRVVPSPSLESGSNLTSCTQSSLSAEACAEPRLGAELACPRPVVALRRYPVPSDPPCHCSMAVDAYQQLHVSGLGVLVGRRRFHSHRSGCGSPPAWRVRPACVRRRSAFRVEGGYAPLSDSCECAHKFGMLARPVEGDLKVR